MAVPRTPEILDRITDGFLVLDRQGRFTYVNRPAEEILQKPREALLGHSIWALFPRAAERHVFDRYREAIQEQRPVHFEETLPVQDRCFEVRLYPDAEGTSVIFRDITERKRTEAVLRESEDRFRSLVIATSQIVWTTSPTGESRGEQPGWSAFTGQSPEEYRGLGWLDAVHPEDRARTIEIWSAALRDRRPYELEHRLRRHDGEYRHMWARGAPVLEDNGRVREWVGVHADVTDAKRAEDERERARAEAENFAVELESHAEELQAQATLLEETQAELEITNDELQRANEDLAAQAAEAKAARAEAEAANQAKSDFLATMSHELRTPLNAILGYADLLAMGIGGALSNQQLMHLSRIRMGGEHLIALIDDILDFAKVEAGRMDVAQERALAMEAINTALSLVAPQATARGIVIEDPCAEADNVSFTGDGGRVRQILTNLLSNAVKFTEPGGRIRITCGTTAEPDPEAQLRSAGPWSYVRVEDTGIGIAPEHLAAVFLPFHQVDSGHTRSRGGTGLGLAISRRFARLMGGDLTVRSRPGAGSVFTLWLPAGEVTGMPEEGVLDAGHPAVDSSESLAAVGSAVQTELAVITAAYVERLRIDPEVPQASHLGEAELEDHVAAFVADIAQALVILGQTGGEPTLLRDSADIQRLISERHGAQRARVGWSEDALRREFEILREELGRAVRRRVTADAGEEAGAGIAVLERSLSHAERISLGALRRAAAAGEV